MNHEDQKLLATARKLAFDAGKVIQFYQGKPIAKSQKVDLSVVTEADLRVDRLIREEITKTFPKHGILTEEAGLSGFVPSEFLWVVDPLDGTKAFAHDIAGYCVMIGLLKEMKPYLGVIYDPREGHYYEAVRGHGAFHELNGRRTRLTVSERKKYSEMPLIISTGFPKEDFGVFTNRLGCPVVEPINSVGIKVGLLVRQVGDIYLNHHWVYFWDTCAPQIILEEAGGKMTKANGAPLEYRFGKYFNHENQTIATNGSRHGDLIKIIQQLELFSEESEHSFSTTSEGEE